MALHEVRTPIPGVFYRRPTPEEPEYAAPGDSVTADQTIALVEVMKQFAEIKAGVDGVVVAFSAENEAIIGPGDVIATLEIGD